MEGSTTSLVDADHEASLTKLKENNLNDSTSTITSQSRREYVEITEQPAPKALRFRYECEGRSAGSIPGISSTIENKTYPTIRVVGHEGRAVVVVSCVTKDEPYRPHPHNLVGREGCKKGVCTLEIPPDTMSVSFSNLGIQCVKKKDIEMSLKIREEIRVDPFRTGFNHKNQPQSIDLNSVRLCFQIFLEGDKKGKFTVPLPPLVSDPIYDKKATADLVITKLSDCNSYVDGGRKDIILLCEKVAKDDIQIRFFEEKDGVLIWEAYGDFQPNHVHKQTAIWFQTPRYRTLEVTEPVKVFIQLKRPSDGAVSEPLPFELLPLDAARPSYWSLRRNLMKKGNLNLFSDLLNIKNTENQIKEKLGENNNVIERKDSPVLAEIDPNIQQKNKIDEKQTKDVDNLFVVDMETNNDEVDVVNNELNQIEIAETKINNDENEILDENSRDETFNKLIDDVAELDEIYCTAQVSRINNNFIMEENPSAMNENNNNMASFDDSKTYSSLELAFKNPLDITYNNNQPQQEKDKQQHNVFVPIPEENDNSILKRESPIEKLPPLPPKRQKKIENDAEETKRLKEALMHPKPKLINRSHSFNSKFSQKPKQTDDLKYLGSTSTLPNPKKRGFFAKLFGRKSKNKTSQELSERTSYHSLQIITNNNHNNNDNMGVSSRSTPIRNQDDDDILRTVNHTSNVIVLPDESLDINLDLTDAEHYALYTAMAPHATQSEFDEISCYYAPVEGGKILS